MTTTPPISTGLSFSPNVRIANSLSGAGRRVDRPVADREERRRDAGQQRGDRLRRGDGSGPGEQAGRTAQEPAAARGRGGLAAVSRRGLRGGRHTRWFGTDRRGDWRPVPGKRCRGLSGRVRLGVHLVRERDREPGRRGDRGEDSRCDDRSPGRACARPWPRRVLALLAVSVTSCAGGDTIERTGVGPRPPARPTAGDPLGVRVRQRSPRRRGPLGVRRAGPRPPARRRCSPPTCCSPAASRSPTRCAAAVAQVRGVRAVMPLSLASLSAERPHADDRGRRPGEVPAVHRLRLRPLRRGVEARRRRRGRRRPRAAQAARGTDGLPPAGQLRRRPAGAHRRLRPAGQADLGRRRTTSAASSSGCRATTRCWCPPGRSRRPRSPPRLKKVIGSGLDHADARPRVRHPGADRGAVRQLGHQPRRHLHLQPAPGRDDHARPRLGAALHPHRAGADPRLRHLQQGHDPAAAGRAQPRSSTGGSPTRSTPASTPAATTRATSRTTRRRGSRCTRGGSRST